jgi:lanosterol synthase
MGAIIQTKKGAQQVPIANGQANGYIENHREIPLPVEKTDYSRWRLLDESGRHTWHYLEDDAAAKEWPQTVVDKYNLGLPTVRNPILLKINQW